MALITEMELPVLDVMDPSLRGPRFHEVMIELRDRTWLAAAPFGFVVLDRDACWRIWVGGCCVSSPWSLPQAAVTASRAIANSLVKAIGFLPERTSSR